ncbi:MAG TPA: RecQ family ATP-dependent DNA helicase [Frankiaceae bacterium]|nr:RecQ family ATP-dependent DNA helicase [Frankiaceae bacterium]
MTLLRLREVGRTSSLAEMETLAKDSFAITLRPSQRAALESIAAARDTLAVLPTGSGKSAIYQVGGLASGGLTVVVSPLIALQRDQHQALAARRRVNGEPVRVATLNSTQRSGERRGALARLGQGELDFLMLGPEQLANVETHAALVKTPKAITLFSVDEAHLVSEWGHDFRPEYLRLRHLIDVLRRPPILALTATASPPVQADITRQLGMTNPRIVVADFDRPNISLTVRRTDPHAKEGDALLERTTAVIVSHPTPALVYAMSHARCEDLAERLNLSALKAGAYHAGMTARQRAQVQDRFFAGELDVVAATSAFGMGIDKADVRTVAHAGVPASLDDYYQEIGRAGRDGDPAHAVLIYDPRSLRIPRLFAAQSRIPDVKIRSVVRVLAEQPGQVSLETLVSAAGVSRPVAERVVAELEELGVLGVLDTDGQSCALFTGTPAAADSQLEAAGRRRQAVLGSRIDSMRHYAETTSCRRRELLGYFGEALPADCGNCDNDTVAAQFKAAPAKPPSRIGESPIAIPVSVEVGAAVTHPLWGTGTVLSEDDHELVVSFESVGYRHLTRATLANGLLTPA